MKKFLSLVMALIMTMSLVTVASAADYKDAADIDYKEAVDVMSAIGVLEGSDGKFDPDAKLTRAQGAKIIAYLALGNDVASSLQGSGKVFTDVPASHWAAGYIEYLASEGIVGGVGNGKFDPNGALNNAAFAKMLLVVLGCDQDADGLTGNTWIVNTAKLANQSKIFDGIEVNIIATATREQAALYAFNAITKGNEYDANPGMTTVVGGVTVTTGSKPSDWPKNTNVGADANAFVNSYAKANYSKLVKDTNTETDAFKAPATTWFYKNEEVGTYVNTPDAHYTGKVTVNTIYNLLGKGVCDNLAAANKAEMYVYVDGVGGKLSTTAAAANCVKDSTAKAFGTDYGMTTDVYVIDDGANTNYAKVVVVVKNTYLLQATADYNAKTEKLAVGYVVYPTTPASLANLSADDFDVADYKDDDYILCTMAYNYTSSNYEVQTIEKATVVSGKVTSYKTESKVALDGLEYSYGATVPANNTNGTNIAYTIGETATVVLDAMDNIIYVDKAKAANDDVVYVADVAKNGFDTVAKIVTVDGKKMTVTVDTEDTDTASVFKGTLTNWAANNAKFYAYEVEDDGEYVLSTYTKASSLNVGAAGTITMTKTPGLISGYVANSDTVYLVKDADGDINVYTGVKNAPNVTVSGATKIQYVFDDTELLYVYVETSVADGITEASSNDDTLVYVLKKAGKKLVDKDKNEYVEVKALVDGVEKTLKVKYSAKDTFKTNGVLFKNLKVNADGFVTGATEVQPETNKYGTFSVVDQGDAFDYDKEAFTVKTTGSNTESMFVETDKVTLVVTKGVPALLNDDDASFEVYDTTFAGLETFVKSYTVSATGYTCLNTEGDVTAAYVTITDACETTNALTGAPTVTVNDNDVAN